MNLLHLPWLEVAIAIALVGSACISLLRDPFRAYRWGLTCTGLTFGCTLLAWLAFALGVPPRRARPWTPHPRLFGRELFALDALNAPLIPAIALLHFLTASATSRAHMRRFSSS